MTENEIKFASNYIANIALEPNGVEKVNIAIQSLLSTYLKEASFSSPKNDNFKPLSTIITFTQKELSHMDKNFKKILILNGLVARVRTRPSGKNKFLYEIRFRARGYSIIACDSSLEMAKAKFIAKASPNEIDKCKVLPSKLRRKGKHLFYQIFQDGFL